MTTERIRKFGKGPEAEIQRRIIAKLRMLEWSVRETHGNMYQCGFPDLYCCHRSYGSRWVEVKDPNRTGDVFTPAQHEYFHELASHGIGVWVLTGDSEEQLRLLHGEPNWYWFLGVFRRRK